MTRKHRDKRREFPWPLLAFGALFLGAAAFLLLNRADGSGGGTPAIAVDRDAIDFGDVKLNNTRAFSITVNNMGDGVLRFKEKPYIEVREGC